MVIEIQSNYKYRGEWQLFKLMVISVTLIKISVALDGDGEGDDGDGDGCDGGWKHRYWCKGASTLARSWLAHCLKTIQRQHTVCLECRSIAVQCAWLCAGTSQVYGWYVCRGQPQYAHPPFLYCSPMLQYFFQCSSSYIYRSNLILDIA